MKPHNVVDKYAVCVKKNNAIVGHLPLGRDGRLLKWYFISLEQIDMQNAKL